MKKFLIGLSAAALLAGVASANAQDSDRRSGARNMQAPHASTTVKKKRYYSGMRRDGYSTLPPKRDYGRYSNLPGKDALNSKAFIQDH